MYVCMYKHILLSPFEWCSYGTCLGQNTWDWITSRGCVMKSPPAVSHSGYCHIKVAMKPNEHNCIPKKSINKKAAEAGFGVLEFWSKISFRHPETHLYTMFININVFSLPISDFIPHLCFASSYARECSWVRGQCDGSGKVSVRSHGRRTTSDVIPQVHPRWICLLLLLFVLYVFRQSSTDLGWTGWAVSPRGLFIPSSVPGLQMGTSVRSSQTVLKVRLFLPVFRHLPPWMNHHNQLSFS